MSIELGRVGQHDTKREGRHLKYLIIAAAATAFSAAPAVSGPMLDEISRQLGGTVSFQDDIVKASGEFYKNVSIHFANGPSRLRMGEVQVDYLGGVFETTIRDLEYAMPARDVLIPYLRIKGNPPRAINMIKLLMQAERGSPIHGMACAILQDQLEIVMNEPTLTTLLDETIAAKSLSLFTKHNPDLGQCHGEVIIAMENGVARSGADFKIEAVEGQIVATWPFDGRLPEDETGTNLEVMAHLSTVSGAFPDGGPFSVETVFSELALDGDSLIPLAQSGYNDVKEFAERLSNAGGMNPLIKSLDRADLPTLWNAAIPATGYAAVGFFDLNYPGIWNYTNYMNRPVEGSGPASFILELNKEKHANTLTALLETEDLGKFYLEARGDMVPSDMAPNEMDSVIAILDNPPVMLTHLAIGAEDKGWTSGLHAIGYNIYNHINDELSYATSSNNFEYYRNFLHGVFESYRFVDIVFHGDYFRRDIEELFIGNWRNVPDDVEVMSDSSRFDPSVWPTMESFRLTPFERAETE